MARLSHQRRLLLSRRRILRKFSARRPHNVCLIQQQYGNQFEGGGDFRQLREGRLSHRVSLCLNDHLQKEYASVDMLDLKAFGFPLLSERFSYLKEQSPAPDAALMANLTDFRERLLRADHLYIVSPVYNTSFPAALKNIIDAYYTEWAGKKVGLCSVSSGMVPGIATLQSLQTLIMAMGATVAPGLFTFTSVDKDFDEQGRVLSGSRNEKTLHSWIKAVQALG